MKKDHSCDKQISIVCFIISGQKWVHDLRLHQRKRNNIL